VANDEALFVDGRGGRFMRALLLPRLFSLLVLCMLLAGGCGGGDGGGETLEIADIGWTENTAIAQTTKVILEEELGYEEVTVHTSDLDSVYEDVARGDLDAFQDVWLPNQQDLLGSVEDDVELLGPWYQGQTKQGIGVPSYMEATSLDQLAESEADLLLGIEPSSVVMGTVSEEVIPAYDLDQKLVEASTPGMLAEVENRYDSREEFAFIAWSPHWMNQRYDFRYLEDPKDALGELNDPARF
jgi:glycine betaine/proline transport system substrate-binding protein